MIGTREPNPNVYGKDGAVSICVFPLSAGLDSFQTSKYCLFEAAYPIWWCKGDYGVASVDVRGSHQSEGNKGYCSKEVGLDGDWFHTTVRMSEVIDIA
jgi:hypothetical protein